MTASVQNYFDKVFAQLQEDGLLMLSDPDLPSLSGIIAGEKIRGSWWSHELGQTIFTVSEMIEEHKDVMITKLISRKVTFVHRELWNEIYSIGVARERWQWKKLSPKARRFLKVVDGVGTTYTYDVRTSFTPIPADVARELDTRLLVHTEQVHTETGKHARVVETWAAWAARADFRPRATDPVAARHFLEQRMADINQKHNGRGKLPWQ
ncbi:MAG TPA: hypothetical protein VFR51_18495 [Pyrinomonadaceae bacterium]|nr:hypothetical protein [Pyrinomonadaceae bacterium]